MLGPNPRERRNESDHIFQTISKNDHTSNSQDRRTYQEEKGERSEISHQERRNESNHTL